MKFLYALVLTAALSAATLGLSSDPDLGWNNFLFGPGSSPAEIRRHRIETINGTIPAWLDGVWVQNGPGAHIHHALTSVKWTPS